MSPPQPEETHVDLKSLVGIIQTLPGDIQRTLAGPVIHLNNTLNRRSKILKLVQDALGQIRLDMKYLMFDLEATRRERDELKGRLGE